MIPITALLVALTPAQVRAVMVQNLIQLGIRADLWNQGGAASTILTVVATTFAGFTATMAAALGAGFLPTASGAWLVLLAYYVYGVVAVPATFATGFVTLTNTGGGIYTWQPGQLIIGNVNKSTVQYSNVNVVTLGAATAFGPMVVAGIQAQANLLGSAGNANPGDASALVTSAVGVTATNPGAIVGQDAQSDASVRTTCLAKLSALSVRNPRNAYLWAVTTALNAGVPVNINRVQVLAPGATYVSGVPLSPPAAGSPGTVTVYCASPSGTPSSGDLAAAGANIEANVRAEGVTASVLAATAVTYTKTLTIWYQASANLTAAAVQAAAATAVTAYFASYPIGGLKTDSPSFPTALFGSGITGAIVASQAPGVVFFVEDASNIGSPPPDLALSAGQVAVDAITFIARAVAGT